MWKRRKGTRQKPATQKPAEPSNGIYQEPERRLIRWKNLIVYWLTILTIAFLAARGSADILIDFVRWLVRHWRSLYP